MPLVSPEQDRAEIQQLIRPGERLLWVGRSDPAVWFNRTDVWRVPCTIAWCSFTILWEVSAIRGGASVIFDSIGLLFVCAGLFIVAGRFVVKAWRKQRTVYALTDRRMIVSTRSSVTDQLLTNGVPLIRQRWRNHLTVTFGSASRPSRRSDKDLNSGLESSFVVAFYDVADADALEAALDQVPWGGVPRLRP